MSIKIHTLACGCRLLSWLMYVPWCPALIPVNWLRLTLSMIVSYVKCQNGAMSYPVIGVIVLSYLYVVPLTEYLLLKCMYMYDADD